MTHPPQATQQGRNPLHRIPWALFFLSLLLLVGCSDTGDGGGDGGVDPELLACGNTELCDKYYEDSNHYHLIWQALYMDYACDLSEIPGAIDAGVEYEGCAVFLISEWIDWYADKECGLHCIKSGHYFHAIDLESDQVTILKKLEKDEIPDSVSDLLPIEVQTVDVDSVQKRYYLLPTYAEPLNFHDPAHEISCWVMITDLSPDGGAAQCAPIPLVEK